MTNFQQIITNLVNQDERGQEGVAEKVGVSKAYISFLVNGKRKLSKDMAAKFEEVYKLNAAELIKKQKLEDAGVEIRKSPFDLDTEPDPEIYPPIEDQLIKVVNRKKKPQDTVTPQSNDNYMMVEYQDLATAAGTMGGETIESLPDTKRRLVPREYDNGNFLVVRVDGDSMDDGSKYSIPNGTEILIKEFHLDNGDTLPIRNNLFVIVSRDGTALKQITEHEPGEYIVCHSYNPKFKDYTVKMEDVIQIFIYRKIVSSRPEIPDIN